MDSAKPQWSVERVLESVGRLVGASEIFALRIKGSTANAPCVVVCCHVHGGRPDAAQDRAAESAIERIVEGKLRDPNVTEFIEETAPSSDERGPQLAVVALDRSSGIAFAAICRRPTSADATDVTRWLQKMITAIKRNEAA